MGAFFPQKAFAAWFGFGIYSDLFWWGFVDLLKAGGFWFCYFFNLQGVIFPSPSACGGMLMDLSIAAGFEGGGLLLKSGKSETLIPQSMEKVNSTSTPKCREINCLG